MRGDGEIIRVGGDAGDWLRGGDDDANGDQVGHTDDTGENLKGH